MESSCRPSPNQLLTDRCSSSSGIAFRSFRQSKKTNLLFLDAGRRLLASTAIRAVVCELLTKPRPCAGQWEDDGKVDVDETTTRYRGEIILKHKSFMLDNVAGAFCKGARRSLPEKMDEVLMAKKIGNMVCFFFISGGTRHFIIWWEGKELEL